MHHLQCHGPFRPFSMLPESPIVSASPSSCASDVRLTSDHQRPQQPQSPRRNLKRRASQGSILTKPSSVSRFLSRTSGSRTLSVDSQYRPSSAAPSSPFSPSPLLLQGDYHSALPPTPPDEQDYHLEWNSKSAMLMLKPQINQVQGPGHGPLDQPPNMNMESTPRPPLTVDGLSSPSDQSSTAASPGSTEMDVDHNTWLENGIDAASRFLPS